MQFIIRKYRNRPINPREERACCCGSPLFFRAINTAVWRGFSLSLLSPCFTNFTHKYWFQRNRLIAKVKNLKWMCISMNARGVSGEDVHTYRQTILNTLATVCTRLNCYVRISQHPYLFLYIFIFIYNFYYFIIFYSINSY